MLFDFFLVTVGRGLYTPEVKILLNLPSIILVLILVNVKILIMLVSFLERGHHVGDTRPRASHQLNPASVS